MEDEEFIFKRFRVKHGMSSMKIGVDAVLLGCWAGIEASKILDVGTGCGVIAMILAQRFPNALIKGIDVDQLSVIESEYNFKNCPWSARLKSEIKDFPGNIDEIGNDYDLIVSNPPYFKSGVNNPETRREKARHQKSLSVNSLLEYSSPLLNEKGRLSMIFPMEFEEEVISKSNLEGWELVRICRVKNNERRPFRRVMMEFCRDRQNLHVEDLVMFNSDGSPTFEYRKLCEDFYLKF